MKHLFFSFTLLVFVGCKDQNTSSTNTSTEAPQQTTATTDAHHDAHQDAHHADVYSNAWIGEILMNEGDKWQSDLTTNEGVKKLQSTFTAQATSTLADYHKLAEQLNEDKNYLVKNCTMDGPAHDNLHTWLHPLIEKIDALSKAETVEDASEIKRYIDENINAYYDYFK